jgi:hypothetical protein
MSAPPPTEPLPLCPEIATEDVDPTAKLPAPEGISLTPEGFLPTFDPDRALAIVVGPPVQSHEVAFGRRWIEAHPRNPEAARNWCLNQAEEVRRLSGPGSIDPFRGGIWAMRAADDARLLLTSLGIPLPARQPRIPDPDAPLRAADDAIQFLAECAGQCATGRRGGPGSQPVGAAPGDPDEAPSRPDRPGGKMTVEDANRTAMVLAKKLQKGFFAMSETGQAKLIGCHLRTWRKTPFYRVAKKKRAKTNAPGARRAVTLTDALEAVAREGDKDDVLRRLIADQEADREPSPLEDDPPDSRPKTVHSRKRL